MLAFFICFLLLCTLSITITVRNLEENWLLSYFYRIFIWITLGYSYCKLCKHIFESPNRNFNSLCSKQIKCEYQVWRGFFQKVNKKDTGTFESPMKDKFWKSFFQNTCKKKKSVIISNTKVALYQDCKPPVRLNIFL